MKQLTPVEQDLVSAGHIIPGIPSESIQCINIKLMINVGRNEPGFDETVAALAYQKYCGCMDMDKALQFVKHGEHGKSIRQFRVTVFEEIR